MRLGPGRLSPTLRCSTSAGDPGHQSVPPGAGLGDGLLVGMMSSASGSDDATCLRVAHAFERLSGGFPAAPAAAGALAAQLPHPDRGHYRLGVDYLAETPRGLGLFGAAGEDGGGPPTRASAGTTPIRTRRVDELLAALVPGYPDGYSASQWCLLAECCLRGEHTVYSWKSIFLQNSVMLAFASTALRGLR